MAALRHVCCMGVGAACAHMHNTPKSGGATGQSSSEGKTCDKATGSLCGVVTVYQVLSNHSATGKQSFDAQLAAI